MSDQGDVQFELSENDISILRNGQVAESLEDPFTLRPIKKPKSETPSHINCAYDSNSAASIRSATPMPTLAAFSTAFPTAFPTTAYHDSDVLAQSIEMGSESPIEILDRDKEYTAVDDDSDEDCVIMSIGPAQSTTGLSNRTITIKAEPELDFSPHAESNSNPPPQKAQVPYRDQALTPEQMIALQRMRIPLISSRSNASTAIPSTPRHRKRRRQAETFVHDGGHAEVDNSIHADEEDDQQWMHQESSTVEEDEEYINAKVQLKALLKEQAVKGRLSSTSAAELGRVNNIVVTMDRVRGAHHWEKTYEPEKSYDDGGEGLFIPETRQRSTSTRDNREGPSSMPENYTEFDNQNPDAALVQMLNEELNGNGLIDGDTPQKQKKPRRRVGKTAREVHEIMKEQEKENARRKSQKKKGRPPMVAGAKGKKTVEKARDKTAARKGKGKGKGKGKRKTGAIRIDETANEMQFMQRRDGEDNLGKRILDELITSDPISDRLRDPIFRFGPEPEIVGSGSKTTQLQRLYANIPDGSSKSKGRSDKAKLLQASRSFGRANVKAVDGKWLVKGMRSTLYHHQLLGAQWMVARELSSEPPHGGLLADSMGLGKTVQTLACMVGNPPTDEDCRRGITATLIVVPSSVLHQWMEEIELHVSALPKVMIYKRTFPVSHAVLRSMDVVLTTYTEVMKQFPFPDRIAREQIANMGYQSWWNDAIKDLGILHQINWRRVVLDEAHAIKNNTARTSLACQNLRSMYRWCLTGTPLLNRLEE
ncbi:hypothetical protein ACMFMF_003074 [Clarireedia jacksonii]